MFSRFFIYRPIFAAVISIVIVLVGVLSIPLLPVESMPDITPPSVQVSTAYPGAGASVVAESVTAPMEERINGVENMLYMSSKSASDGSCNITITFEVGTDIDMATVLVQNRVNEALPVLPEEVKRQGVKVEKQSTNITLMVNMVSPNGTYDELYISNYVTTRIKDVVARINGVSKVNIFGAKDFGMRIWIDPLRLRARGLTTSDIVNALREQNVQVAAGQIGGQPAPRDQPFQYSISTLGRLETVEQFENIIVKRGGQAQLVRVRDVARVELGAQSYQWYAELDGAPSIALGIYPAPGANALQVAEGVKAQMAELAEDFPDDLEYRVLYDTTEYITQSLKEVVSTLVVAVLLVVFTVYIFLQDLRTTLVPAITIPVSLLGTFAVMLALGLSINGLTMFGLILVIGIVVDDAIVVVENTMRIIDEEGLPAKEATAKSMLEITGPVVATTLVLLAVFVPTIVMPGIVGRLYRPFAITISVATLFSSINALTLSPALCGMLLRPSRERTKGFFGLFNRALKRTSSGYRAVVGGLLRKAVIGGAVFAAMLVAAWFGVTALPTGFVPPEDEGYFMISAQLPDAASLGRTQEVMNEVSAILADTEGIRGAVVVGGFSLLDSVVAPNAGVGWVVLDHWDERSSPDLQIQAVVDSINRRLATIQGAFAFAVRPPPIQGLGTTGGSQMELQDRGGAGLELLQQVAYDIQRQGARHPVLGGVNTTFRAGVPQLFLEVDREKARRLDVPLDVIFSTLQANLGSAYVNDFNLFGRVWRVLVQADEPFRLERADITRLEVRSNSGRMVPLATLIEVRDTVGPTVESRYNLFPSASLIGGPKPGHSSGEAMAAMEELARNHMPPSMGFEWTGVAFQERAAGGAAVLIFALALVFVYLFLAAQYESWSLPLSVMLTLPAAVLGAAALTLLRGLDNNVYFQIGLVLLIGLSSKSAILIVEFANQLANEGRTPFEAAMEAATLRFRAILMTAFSFILGVIPLVVATGAGAASRVSLGTAVFGGMLFATVGGLIITPFLFYLVRRVTTRSAAPEPEPSEAGAGASP
ncbi:MAG TPA: multidrug efflux RND transporter permease subunit [Candidatus Sulfomarinibacteraceae bacterium]|nr:multidrug efflux RND transporter permease subunit [Candidatus Sulfomarinibacteraceae bacterium]